MSRDRSRTGRARDAAVAGAALGAAGGAALGGSFETPGPLLGAVVGAIIIGAGEAWTDLRRESGELKPAWWRIIASANLVAALSWLVERAVGTVDPILFGLVVGLVVSAIGARWAKVFIGLVSGMLVGWLLGNLLDPVHLPVVGAAVTLVYRSLAWLIYRNQELTQVKGEGVDPGSLPFLVPFAADGPTVGADFLEDRAAEEGWDFVRSPADAGIVATLDALEGPEFSPARVEPLIREFYEHTTRFELDIVPEWRWWMKAPYWIFQRTVSLRIDQINVPFNQREAQRGMVSYIDVARPSERDPIRAWVRVFQDTGAPIYVGIYTTTRHDGVGYVAVGFPLPRSNITVALAPRNLQAGGLLLSSRFDETFCGHYLTAIEGQSDVTTLRLGLFDEEIEVYLHDRELLTDHRFYLGKVRFLTLHYSISRKASAERT